MTSARCSLCGGTTARGDAYNRAERRRTHRRNPSTIRPVSIDHEPTCPEHPANRHKRQPVGEYVVELRDNSQDMKNWRLSVDMDPVPDMGDLATERAAAQLRAEVATLNRQAGWYKYRTLYVPTVQKGQ